MRASDDFFSNLSTNCRRREAGADGHGSCCTRRYDARPRTMAADHASVDSFASRSPMPALQSINRREILPETRHSKTHKFSIGAHEGYLTVGLFDDGRPGEIFIKMSKEGSTLSGLIQGFCRAFSIALQYGLPLEEAVARFKGMRFEPMGHTSNPDIPEAMSLIDYVARSLETTLCDW